MFFLKCLHFVILLKVFIVLCLALNWNLQEKPFKSQTLFNLENIVEFKNTQVFPSISDLHEQIHILAGWCSAPRELLLTVMGLWTAATMKPMVGWGDGGVGLAHGPPSSALLLCPSPGNGEWSFCSCCFLWIFLWSCCFASTEGEEMVEPWGRKEWASAAGTNAETDCRVLFSKEQKQHTYMLPSSYKSSTV